MQNDKSQISFDVDIDMHSHMTSRCLFHSGHDQLPVINPFLTEQFRSQSLQIPGPAFHGNGLKAMVMIEMDVLDRKDQFMVIMLEVSGTVLQLSLVMVVYQHNGTGYHLVGCPLVLDKKLPDEMPDRPGTVGNVIFL
jgi:hypothetical protein